MVFKGVVCRLDVGW